MWMKCIFTLQSNDAAQDAIEMFAFYRMEKKKLHPLSNWWFQDIKIIILTLTGLKKQKLVNVISDQQPVFATVFPVNVPEIVKKHSPQSAY